MPQSAQKICQNCQQKFIIEPEDFLFYEKIKVPPPTFCPECRLIRRMSWRNEKSLYKRKCDFSKENIFSVISPDKPFKVYNYKTWWSDEWDPINYGQAYDFSKPFFEQFKKLLLEFPWLNRFATNLVNSDYCMNAAHLKNCYLIFYSNYNEDCAFGNGLHQAKDCFDNSYFRTYAV
ncbi:hypothetical protein HY750_01005 [Candidatus Kuenenbacteria bacterium]|nr:hypothetical protein [Candidatus Kuenenbacteria bacterium]